MGNFFSAAKEAEDASAYMSLPFYDNNQILTKLSPNPGDYVFMGVGSFGCAFRGPFDGRNDCIIKFNRYFEKKNVPVRDVVEVYNTSVREANVGNFMNKKTLESGWEHWAQTLAFGFYIGPMPAFAASAKVKAPQCAADFDKPYMLHYIIVQEQAGRADLSSWMNVRRTVSTEHICKIAFQCCWALFTASATFGFIHCDLKPDNLVVDEVRESKVMSYVIDDDEVASFSVKYDPGDPHIRVIDYGLGFMAGSPAEQRETSAFWYPSGGTPIFSPMEYYTSDTSADITSARDMFSIGITLVCLKAHNVLSLGRGVKYNYQTMQQPPVSGQTAKGQGPEASEFAADAFTFKTKSDKHVLCESLWGRIGIDEHRERAKHVAQTLLLQRALGVDITSLKSFVAAFLPPERTAYEQNVRNLFKNTQVDLLLLDFIQRLLAVDARERLSFGLPVSIASEDRHAFNNALFHALFVDSGFTVEREGGTVMRFQYGARMPLPFHDDKEEWLDVMKKKDNAYLSIVPAYRDPKSVVVVEPPEKENVVASSSSSQNVQELTRIFLAPNVETGLDPSLGTNVKIRNRHAADATQSTANEDVLRKAYDEITRQPNVARGVLKGYLNNEGKRLKNWNPAQLTRVMDPKKKKREPDPSNNLTSLVAGTLLHLAARKDAGPYLKEAEASPFGAYNDEIAPLVNVDLAPYRERAVEDARRRAVFVQKMQFSLPEVRDILESIEHCPAYTQRESGTFAFEVIATDLLPAIEEGLNRHAATIKGDPALRNALRPLIESNGALVFPSNVPGQIRYFHWLSVVVDMLHSIDVGLGVDTFLFQRCQSEMPPSFLPAQQKGKVQHV